MTKFYQLSPAARLAELTKAGLITDQDKKILQTAIDQDQLLMCDSLSENVVSGYVLPLSIIPEIVINNKSYSVPMVTEETSVVAAINNMAKLIKNKGKITTKTCKNIGIGQIYIPKIKADFFELVALHQASWQEFANNNALKSMRARGGGMLEIKARLLSNDSAVLHFHIDTCDAMGANIINQTLEELGSLIKADLDLELGIKILSNLTDTALTEVTLAISLEPQIAQAIVEAAEFAEHDPYRACTHNKGIMNGIDAVLIATGNDWRAVEAAMHTYAKQKPMSSWHIQNNILVGKLKAPINVGICGGITKVQPQAQACLNILNVASAAELAGIISTVGLMQNLAALMALATKGICAGHMRLHINTILKELMLSQNEANALTKILTNMLKQGTKISVNVAAAELKKIRENT